MELKVKIQFRTHKLKKQYQDFILAQKAYGEQVARKYIQRIIVIKSAQNIDVLKKLPGLKCHALKGDRLGQWALKLTGYYRLIFTLHGEYLEIAQIEEVSKHYED